MTLGRSSETELDGGLEIIEDAAPGTFIASAAAVALVDDDEIEEVAWVFAEVWGWLAVLRRSAHERLENGEEEAAVLGNLAFLADVFRSDADEGVFGEWEKAL